eukprot:Blabericola_migrator_1__7363@NODE_3742_length_1541_cov_363_084125_g2322_i0_p1_GENE_NODE_3742_length_1541_cov_363_084125_g2322_i0NODE_3742_length_1541_cov_363_084125_g2322_i0_p1_ORF_typecomplete_len322_score70_34HABP4_PAIRBP1/PF04774_15/1_2e04HABP4_PAIRBP1/PF04774_15/3_2e15HABP4_PAIRBP1/PF04774_15/3_3e03HABP4_PAIRBP1/PF04774_15/3_1e03_NODE_3742_length_1541_cov_363_084125_g2322_i05311496
MVQHYTVPTKNAFAALDDSDDEGKILDKPEVDPALEAAAQAPRQHRQTAEQSDRPRQRQGPRGDNNTRPAGQRRPRPIQNENAGDEDTQVAGPPVRRNADKRPPRKSSAEHPPKREFDRQSGTGRGREVSKGGYGAHNWGSDRDALIEEKAAELDAVPVGEEAEAPAAPVEEVPVAPKTKSYAEYMAEMEERKRALLPQTKVEPAQDPEKLEKEGYSVYTKESVSATRGHKEVDSDKEENEGKKKVMHLAEIAEQSGVQIFHQGSRGGRGGRGRGGDRFGNRGGREGDRAAPKEGAAQRPAPTRREINLADSAAFPTLQAH